MATDKFVDANGLRLHYLDYGNEGAPWVVCIHGLSRNAHNFDALAAHLAAKYHVISIDVRGRGDSQWGPPTEYLPQNYVTDLAKMLEELGVARVSLIGTSMGGIISMMYAGGWPERVERLVINDIGCEIDQAGLARIAIQVGGAPERFKDMGEAVKYYRENYPYAAKLADDAIAEEVKWSVKPGDRRWPRVEDGSQRAAAASRRHGAAAARLVGAVRAHRLPGSDTARRGQRYPGCRDGEPDVHGAQAGEGRRSAGRRACPDLD